MASSITITPIAPNNQKSPIHPNRIQIENNKRALVTAQ